MGPFEPFPDDIFNLADIALRVAREDPERIAVIEPHGRHRYRRYTYKKLSEDVESVAPGLREMGVKEGTRIVCMAPPSYETAVFGLALTRVGALTIWIDPWVGYRRVAERLRRVHPEGFLGNFLSHIGRVIFGWGPRISGKFLVAGKPGFPGARSIESLRRKPPSEPIPPAVTPDDPCVILYTTGTTGPAKPSLYKHRNFCQVFRNAHHSWRFWQDGGPPVDMAVFPAFMFISISAGGTMVVPPINFARETPAKVNPRALVEVITDCGVKSFFAAPILLENLARYAIKHGITLPSLKRVITGTAPVSGQVVRDLLKVMNPKGEVAINYGATEALPSTEIEGREYLSDAWEKTEKGAGWCVGRPLPGVELKVIDIVEGPISSIDEAVELTRNKIGEILIRGKHVSPEYYLDEENTRKNKVPDKDGGAWHRLGDAGYLDSKGRLWVCGRISERVKTKDGPIFPLMCEPIFNAHPKVKRSALLGIAGPEGELPVLCVEVKPEHRRGDMDNLKTELQALARDSGIKIREILFKREMPVDPRHNSRIQRLELVRWASRRVGRGV